MELNKTADKLGWKLLTNIGVDDLKIENGYTGDLLSDVLANAKPGSVWFTIQKHKNILGVAAAKDLSAVVLCGGNEPDKELVTTAENRNLPIFLTENDTFITAGEFYKLLGNDDF